VSLVIPHRVTAMSPHRGRRRAVRRRALLRPRLSRRAVFAGAVALLCLAAAAPARAALVGTSSLDYGFDYGNTVSAPTAEKPQSKAWVRDGTWFAAMWNKSAPDTDGDGKLGRYETFKLDRSTTPTRWQSEGVAIDERSKSSADTLWDGSWLYVATAVRPCGTICPADEDTRILRYVWNGGTFVQDTSFGAALRRDPADGQSAVVGYGHRIASGPIENVVIDKDSQGRLWITYTKVDTDGFHKVYVAHSDPGGGGSWTPYVLPAKDPRNPTAPNPAATLKAGIDGDTAALVAYKGKIGVLWSHQNKSTPELISRNGMWFAYHDDNAAGEGEADWTTTRVVESAADADDHINLKTFEADPSGQLFAVTKTSRTVTGDPLIVLHVLDRFGSWRQVTFGKVEDNHTRPILLIDRANRRLYVLATSGPTSGGGAIFYKHAPLDNPTAFLEPQTQNPGLGWPFMGDDATTATVAGTTEVNNATSTKQALDGRTDLVALAADDSVSPRRYWHNILDLPPLTDEFEYGGQTGGQFVTEWTATTSAGATATVQGSYRQAGGYAARFAASSTATAYARRRLDPPEKQVAFTGHFQIAAEGSSTGTVPLFRLYDPGGNRIVSLYHRNSDDKIAIQHGITGSSVTAATSVRLPVDPAHQSWHKLELRLTNPQPDGTSTIEVLREQSGSMTRIYGPVSTNLGTGGIATVQLGQDTSSRFEVLADNVMARKP
jgi:hypothetical protein